jgi:hypothetical protein
MKLIELGINIIIIHIAIFYINWSTADITHYSSKNIIILSFCKSSHLLVADIEMK